VNTKVIFQTIIGAAGYIGWAVMAFLDPTLRADFLHFNIAMAVGTIGLVLRDMKSSDQPSAPKEGGFARLPMLGVLGAAAVLAACQTMPGATPAQSTQVTSTQACASWGAAFDVALQLRKAGKLNRAQIDQITLLDSQVTPICTGPMPTDPDTAAKQVTAAVTTLTILELAAKEAK
jgi:hypothetical protein